MDKCVMNFYPPKDLKARIEKEATNKDNFAFDLLEKKAGN